MSIIPRVLVSLSAYASEGGLDGRYQPATCFSPTIALGRHWGPGDADGLWQNYEAVLDLAGDLGLTGVCLEVSWARLEPRRGRRDQAVLARYAEVIAYAQRRGLFVSVAAIDAAWPAWLGLEAWLMPWVMPVAIGYVRWIAASLEADALSVFAARELLTRGFLDATAGPPWRHGAGDDAVSAARNLEIIERTAREGSARPLVTSVSIDLDDVDDAGSFDVDEVHVKSLVRGTGPLASARGLLARRCEEWIVLDTAVAPPLVRP